MKNSKSGIYPLNPQSSMDNNMQKKKTVGILTIWQTYNYGAELQAFALQKKLNLMGVSGENIDFPFYKNPDFHKFRSKKSEYSIGLQNMLKEMLFPVFSRISGEKNHQIMLERFQNFHQFYLLTNKSGYRYLSVQSLYENPPQYDIFMVGSDQVWNPRIPIAHGPFFLDFAPPKSPRVSYASSFGVDHLPEQAEPYFRKWLAPFSAISVREQKGVEIVRQLTGKEAEHVLDPTLLLTAAEWDCIAAETQPRDHYLLLYDLLPSAKIIQFAKEVASHLNLKIYRICRDSGTKQEIGITQFPTAGPQDFLTLFKNSSYIVTNSFHGMVFSILFEKEFRVLIPETMKNGGRISSLLQLLQLEQNAIKESELKNLNIKHSTDYSKVNTLLKLSRKKSENYLRRTLAL